MLKNIGERHTIDDAHHDGTNDASADEDCREVLSKRQEGEEGDYYQDIDN